MIAPMKKVILVLLDRERTQALKALRRLGLLHPVTVKGSGEGFDAAARALDEARRAVGLLGTLKPPKGAKGAAVSADRGLHLVRAVNALADETKRLYDEDAALTREAERLGAWGDFDPALLAELRAKGLEARLVYGQARLLETPPEGWQLLSLGGAKDSARALLVAPVGTPLALPEGLRELAPGDRSLGALRARLGDLRARLAAIDAEQAAHAADLASAEAYLAKTEQDLGFETVRSGLEAEGPVSWIEGYAPASALPRIAEEAARRSWGMLADDPADDEMPPTMLQNPPAVRMVQPVFDFLGTVPHYREYDISGLFLFFFSFFFAMIFGDGGYGSIMLLGAIFAAIKSKASSGRVSDPIRLLLVLAASTVAWGIATCSWFGIPPEILPGFLRGAAIPWISNENPESGDNVKVLCFSIGMVQLVVAHVKNVKRDWPSLKLIGQLGQFAMVVGMFFLVLNLVISSTRYPVPLWSLYLVAGGFVANFVFGSYDGSAGFVRGVVGGIVSSFANIVSVFLGVVNVFADIVSYIRLWAVGLAGVAISQTVNNMAGPMLGHFALFAVGALLLVFGHGLNLVMSVLSVIVHGVRLNMLEFSGHLGMEWSGYKYEPFRETASADTAE